jgi:hypothetical protein
VRSILRAAAAIARVMAGPGASITLEPVIGALADWGRGQRV